MKLKKYKRLSIVGKEFKLDYHYTDWRYNTSLRRGANYKILRVIREQDEYGRPELVVEICNFRKGRILNPRIISLRNGLI